MYLSFFLIQAYQRNQLISSQKILSIVRREGIAYYVDLLRVCPSSFLHLRLLHLFSSSAKFHFCPSPHREFRLIPSRSPPSFRRMESLPASSSSPTPVTASITDFLAKNLQNQIMGAIDEGSKIKRKLEDINVDHSFVNEFPGDPRSDVTSHEVLHACYSKVSPSVQVDDPQLVAWSEYVAELLDLDHKE